MSTLEVGKIVPATGTAITLGESGDTLTVPSGATLAVASGATLANSGTATGFGVNTPYFYAYLGSDQVPANNTWTKITCDTVAFQTGSTYDNTTNYRWTPAVAGKYFISGQLEARSVTAENIVQIDISIYKNGSQYISGVPYQDPTSSPTMHMGYISGIIDMNTTDYVEFWGAIDTGSSDRFWDNGYQTTHFMGYKLLD
jgi:hypothetical protein